MRCPSHVRMRLKTLNILRNAIRFTVIPAQSGIASRAPTVAASMGLVNGLKETRTKQICYQREDDGIPDDWN